MPEPLTSLPSMRPFSGKPHREGCPAGPGSYGTAHGFVRFQPEVIQFFGDDLYDYDGNWSGLCAGYRS